MISPRMSCLAGFAVVLISACGSADAPTTPTPPPTPAPPPALLGADISALERIEQGGATFRDSAGAADAIAILRAHGVTLFRLRVFVAPNHTDVQVNDLAYTVRMATRITASGAKLLLDLHYSDTWADPGHQIMPAAWNALSFDSLEQRVETYTASVIAALQAAGATPDIVQIGNEVDAGMLWPAGQLSYGVDSAASWDHFTRLLKAGIRGVRDATDPSSVRIMVHYSQGGDTGGTRWFFDHLAAYGVSYDLIGLSYYPWWHGALAGLTANLAAAAARFGRDIMIVEAEYPWRAGGWENLSPGAPPLEWPVSPAGQAQFLKGLLAAVASVPGGHGAGVVWWYPEAVQVPGLFVFGGGSLALFGPDGMLLPAGLQFIHP